MFACVLVAMLAACGGRAPEPAKEEAARPSTPTPAQPATPEQAAQQAAKGLEQMAKGLESLATGAGGVKPVEPLSFRDLIGLLPETDGWEKQKPTGERMTSPVSFSQVEGRYDKGDASIEIKIVDSGFNQLLLAPYAMFLATGYERETSVGHEKSTTVNGQPGWETWNSQRKNGEVNALVGKRFLVAIEGNRIDDLKPLHDVASRIDMNRLVALK